MVIPIFTASQILNPLLGGLHDGSLVPGSRLPAERALAERYGASRVCVREALAQLAAWRVIEVRRGSGAVVAPREVWSLGFLPAALAATGLPRPAALQEAAVGALALRRTVMRQALPLVSLRVDRGSPALTAARTAIDAAWLARYDAAAFVRADSRALQTLFAGGAAWPAAWLTGDLGAVAVALAAQRPAALPPDERYLERLHGLLEAVADSEDAVAERLLAAHLTRLDRALLEER